MPMIFPERLKQLRQKKGLTQQEIADLVHVNRVTYTNWEKGKREPSFENLVKLASVLGTSTDYLLGTSDNYIDLEDFETLIKKLPEEEITKLIQDKVTNIKMGLLIAAKETGLSLEQLAELLPKNDDEKEFISLVIQSLKENLSSSKKPKPYGNNSETTETE
jgi:transcriptional regulator, cro/CI family